MYYIYHIKGKKWGMTNNLVRRLKRQNLSRVNDVILEKDLDKAADLEKKLNQKYGYPWNVSQDYRIILKAAREKGNMFWESMTTKEQRAHMSKMQKACVESKSIPIIQYDLDGNFIKEWKSQSQAAKTLKIYQGNIWKVLNNKRKIAGGFSWKYKNE